MSNSARNGKSYLYSTQQNYSIFYISMFKIQIYLGIAERDPKFDGFVVTSCQILAKLAKSWKNQLKADIVK